MSVMRVLVTQRMPVVAVEMLKRASPKLDIELWDFDTPIPEDELLARLPSINGLLVTLQTKIKGDVLKSIGSNLKCISTITVGYDHLDVTALRALGVRVGHTPDVLTETTAELVIALLLATSRRLIESHKCLLTGSVGGWDPLWMCGKDIKGSTVGFVGFGRIAQAVANRLSSFLVKQFYYSTRTQSLPHSSVNGVTCERLNLDDVLCRSDFLIILCSSNESTKGLVDKEFLKKMKEDSVLINASRGDVVNQDDLVDALQSGTIRAAGLDVTTPEPLPKSHPLLHLSNCVVLPHIGSASEQTRSAMAKLGVENLLAALNDEAMPAEVFG